MIWLDGNFHPSIPTCTKSTYCQYCKFKLTNKLTPSARKKNDWMFNNRGGIKQCLKCNVNLCPDCFNHWNGVCWDKISDLYRSQSRFEVQGGLFCPKNDKITIKVHVHAHHQYMCMIKR